MNKSNIKNERGQILILTGNGKGKSTSAFGMLIRALGHRQKCLMIQFIKGKQTSGERDILQKLGVNVYTMQSGFSWQDNDTKTSQEKAQQLWLTAKKILKDPNYDLIVLDELTYMLKFKYLNIDDVVNSITHKPIEQSVIITGRGCHRKLLEIADTISEVRNVKHAYANGLKARAGLDF